MHFDLLKWLLFSYEIFNRAANGTKFSEYWRNDMARRAGYYLGRYYAEMLKDLFNSEVAGQPFVPKKTSPVNHGAASARALAILILEPEYADRIKIRI